MSRVPNSDKFFPLDVLYDTRLGQCRILVWLNGPIHKLTFHWRSDANGDVSSRVSFPLFGTLIALRASPGSGSLSPSANYDLIMQDEDESDNHDLLAGHGLNIGGVAGQQERVLNYDDVDFAAKTHGAGVHGIPVAVPRFVFQIAGAGDEKVGRMQVFWQPKGIP